MNRDVLITLKSLSLRSACHYMQYFERTTGKDDDAREATWKHHINTNINILRQACGVVYSTTQTRRYILRSVAPHTKQTKRGSVGRRMHLHPSPRFVGIQDDGFAERSSPEGTMFPRFPEVPSSISPWTTNATRQTRILVRACFFYKFSKFRRRCVDQSATCVPQMFVADG